jgi:hypothetical protein
LTRPTKQEVALLMADGEAWRKKQDGAGLGTVHVPDIPQEFLARLKDLVAAFDAGTFPEFERAIAAPGDPEMTDVLQDLRRAARMVR